MTAIPLKFDVEGSGAVSGLWQAPAKPRAAFVLAHGAGAGMRHPAMTAIADGLAARGIAVLRYQFPYMERGSKRVDPPKVAQATVRAAVAEASGRARKLALFAGGKSFGGRMTSQAQSAEPLSSVLGLVFFGFPLHLAGKPSVERAEHLDGVKIPMLFLSGTRDALAEPELIKRTAKHLGKRATLRPVDDADHSFHVPARTGKKDAQVLGEILDDAVAWMLTIAKD